MGSFVVARTAGVALRDDRSTFVNQIDGVWWFIDAEGKKFVSIGLNHIEPHLWLAPYNKAATLKK